jgi:hypothetical protein
MTPKDCIEYGVIDQIITKSRKDGGADISDRVVTSKRWNRGP